MKFTYLILCTLLLTTALSCTKKEEEETPGSGNGNNTPQVPSTTTTTTLPSSSTTTTLPSSTTTTLPPVTTTTLPSVTTTTTTTTTSTTTTLPPGSSCTPLPGRLEAGTIEINGGALYTMSDVVTLKLTAPHDEVRNMRISQGENCECGVMERFSGTKTWTLGRKNQKTWVSFIYTDFDTRTSACAKAQITHDDSAPLVTLTADPANSGYVGQVQKFLATVRDVGSGIKVVECQLDNQDIPCAVQNSRIEFSFNRLAAGVHHLSVKAKDHVDLSGQASLSFELKSQLREINQTYKLASNNKVDILMVIDNSGSMEYEQKSMATRMSTLVQQLRGLEWKVGITTTDPRDITLGDGRLIQMKGLPKGEFSVDSSMTEARAQKIIGDTLQRPETGSGAEQGIYTTYRAIERTSIATSPNRTFFRDEAAFATVVISDEDESANGIKNQPENLISFVKSKWVNKNFVYHSIITRPGDNICLNTNGYSYGYAYDKISRLTGAGTLGGAIIGSVCEVDYGSQLAGIANSVQQMVKTIVIECDAIGSIDIMRNGQTFSERYDRQGLRLLFEQPLPVGEYTLKYFCQ